MACFGGHHHFELEDLLVGEAEDDDVPAHLQEDVGFEEAADGLLTPAAGNALDCHGLDVGGGEVPTRTEIAGAGVPAVVFPLQADGEARGRDAHVLRREVHDAEFHAAVHKNASLIYGGISCNIQAEKHEVVNAVPQVRGIELTQLTVDFTVLGRC